MGSGPAERNQPLEASIYGVEFGLRCRDGAELFWSDGRFERSVKVLTEKCTKIRAT